MKADNCNEAQFQNQHFSRISKTLRIDLYISNLIKIVHSIILGTHNQLMKLDIQQSQIE